MRSFLFLSTIYWINFAILLACKYVPFLPVFYFYLFLVVFVYPIGHVVYQVLIRPKLQLSAVYLKIAKILLAMIAISVVNFIFGISYAVNGALIIMSYAIIGVQWKVAKIPDDDRLTAFTSNEVFAIVSSALFTFAAHKGFKIFQFFSDHVAVTPYPSDQSTYYAVLSSLLMHAGSILHGFPINLYHGVNVPLKSAGEIFEGVFLKFSGSDIILFHGVIYSLFLILIFFSFCFTNVLKPGAYARRELDDPWHWILMGMVLVLFFSHYREGLCLFHSALTGQHVFLPWIYMLFAMLIYFSSGQLADKNARYKGYETLAFLLLFGALLVHIVNAGVIFVPFVIFMVYRRISQQHKVWFILFWVITAVMAVIVLPVIFSNSRFVMGFLEFSIKGFHINVDGIRDFLNDLPLFDRIYGAINSFIRNGTLIGNITGAFYSILAFIGYLIFVPVLYFCWKSSSHKFFFVNVIVTIFAVVLLCNDPFNPGLVASYMPRMGMLMVLFMIVDIFLSGRCVGLQRVTHPYKEPLVVVLMVLALSLNYHIFSVPLQTLKMDRNLYDTIQYVKKNTPKNSVIMDDLSHGNYWAYFSGFAYRRVVMERSDFASTFYQGYAKDMDLVDNFYSTSSAALRRDILDQYGVTYVLSSPDHPLDLSGPDFEPVFTSGQYVLYQYKREHGLNN